MSPFNKLLLVVAAALAIGTGVAVAAGTNGGSTPEPSPSVADVSGPCDEAEHADDPRCQGAQGREDGGAPGRARDRGRDHPEDDGIAAEDDGAGEDVSGPCDEAEHAADPRCTGAGGAQGEVDDDHGGNSGPSAGSGPGPGHDDGDDHSGHRGSDDGDHSGRGGGEND